MHEYHTNNDMEKLKLSPRIEGYAGRIDDRDTMYICDPSEIDNDATRVRSKKSLKPKDIYDYLDQHIYGQEEAKKAASLLLWEHTNGIKSVMLFVGPTGCGKTEIFRQLKKLYPFIYIVDASVISEEGFKGNFKLADIFRMIGSPTIAGDSIIVFDEADKMFNPRYSAHGENISFSIQNEFLKLIEGEELMVDGETYDTNGISFVFAGSFESLLKKKKEIPNGIGFGNEVNAKEKISYNDSFTQDDLIKYAGMLTEIAGRIGRIVQLKPMTEEAFLGILNDPDMSPIKEISELFGKHIRLSDMMKKKIAKKAAESGMGVRYMRSEIKNIVEDMIFEDSDRSDYRIDSLPEA